MAVAEVAVAEVAADQLLTPQTALFRDSSRTG